MTGKEFKRRREELGLSQSELARFFEVDVMTISRWERGERAIRATGLVNLAFLLLETDPARPRTFREDPQGFLAAFDRIVKKK